MAWSSAEISANEIAWAAADKPLLGINALSLSDIDNDRWLVGVNKTFADSPVDTDTTKPEARAYDGLPGLQTQSTSSSTSFSLLYEFANDDGEFDFVAVLNSNLYASGVTSFRIDIADDNTFATNLQNIVDIDVTSQIASERRFASFDLRHTGSVALRYSTVSYVRFEFVASGSFQPAIGQIILGRRYQMQHAPDYPFDDYNRESLTGDYESRGGVVVRNSWAEGRRLLDAVIRPNTAALQTDIKNFYKNTKSGVLPFVWCDNPNSTPDDFWFMIQETPSLSLPWENWSTRRLNLVAKEQGPTFFELEE